MADTVDWPGLSGTRYRYWFLATPSVASSIHSVGGNYAFVTQLPNGNFYPLYFGKADDLSARIPNHERWAEAVQRGATFVMAHSTPAGDAARCAEERDLIQRWNPVLNVQHRTVLG
ncbi:GIY-YIG nuclease family protein [Hyphomicrobium sp. 1Nfss2.1]